MTAVRIGSLCSGYGGLDLAVEEVTGGRTVWVSDIDPGACKVLAHRFPDAPNLGDMTAVDWTAVEPVDVLCGGTPCQDLSHAGKRAGMTDGTRSNLWVAMREAIAALRPSLVVWENVAGAYSACADSEIDGVLGRCPRCVDPDSRAGHAPNLRALGRVLGDLASLGFDAEWYGLRASDVGAPHGRLRVFVVAWPADAAGDPWGFLHRDSSAAADTPELGHQRSGQARDRWARPADGDLFPTPRATDGTKGGPNQRGSSGDLMLPSAVQLLPTPAVNDMGEGKTVEAWDAWTEKMKARHGNGNGHGASLAIEAQRLLPTPTTMDHKASGAAGYGGNEFCTLTDAAVRQPDRWGRYAASITRWEQLTRPAPAPTETTSKGTQRLAAAFSEWLMGMPAGWVTDAPGVTRNEALRLAGNGVVPQQATYALRVMLTHAGSEVAA